MKYRALIYVRLEVEADDANQAEEDAAMKLIHMIRNDEIAFNIYPLSSGDEESK